MFYWFMRKVIGRLLRVIYRPWTRGLENVPAEGPVILASNHLAVIDSFFMPIVLPRRVVFLGKNEYFSGRGLRGRLVAGFMRGVGTIPIDRSGGSAAEGALRAGLKQLESGGVFGIYPEGTRSPDGRLYRGKTGVARLALESGAPVVPVAMIGTNVAQPIGQRVPRLRRTGVVFGQPLDFSRYAGMENDRFILRSITDEIMYQLMALSGQEYVDVYASTMKARLAVGVDPKGEGLAVLEETEAPGGRQAPDVEVPGPPEEENADDGEAALGHARDDKGRDDDARADNARDDNARDDNAAVGEQDLPPEGARGRR